MLICLSIGVGISFISIESPAKERTGFVIESKENYFIVMSNCEKLYVRNYNNEFEIGDYLKIQGEKQTLEFTTLESSFDFGKYLNKKGINYEFECQSVSYKWKNFVRLRAFRKWFISHFNEETQSTVKSMFFGENSSGNLVNNLNDLHLNRFASLSGLYIYFFIEIIEKVFHRFLKEKHIKVITILFLASYFIITFPKFSIFRILLMQCISWTNKYIFKNKLTFLSIIGVAAISCLLLDFHNAYQDSFILGFGIPTLVYFLNGYTSRFKRKLWRKAVVVIGIYLAFIPFEIKYHNSLSVFLLLNQLLLSPIFMLFDLFSLISFFGIPIYDFINWGNNVLVHLTNFLLKGFLTST